MTAEETPEQRALSAFNRNLTMSYKTAFEKAERYFKQRGADETATKIRAVLDDFAGKGQAMTAEEQAAALYEKLKLHADDIEEHGQNLQLITAALTAYAEEAVKRERERWTLLCRTAAAHPGEYLTDPEDLPKSIMEIVEAAIREPSHG